MNEIIKILILSANPVDTEKLRIDKEFREIEEALKRSKNRDIFEIHSAPATRYKDFRRALLDNEPSIVHFSGHGGPEGLSIEDDYGRATLITDYVLADLFKLFTNKIHCILLNACYSISQADVICQHIDYVIGIDQSIEDGSAIAFSIGFYDALGAGKTIEEAYEFGCNSFRQSGGGDKIPILKKKQINKTNKSSQCLTAQPNKISFDFSNPLLWKVSNEKYTAIGSEDAFAWSEKIIEGDVIISVNVESNQKDGEGVIILYGEGIKWSQGCLIFNITSNSQSIRAHTVYDGAEFLGESRKNMEFYNHIFAVTIEITGDKATMYVDGDKIVSSFLPQNIKRKGRIGLHKHWQRPEVTYSNVEISEKKD